jgi:hypothetical protein
LDTVREAPAPGADGEENELDWMGGSFKPCLAKDTATEKVLKLLNTSDMYGSDKTVIDFQIDTLFAIDR